MILLFFLFSHIPIIIATDYSSRIMYHSFEFIKNMEGQNKHNQ